MGTHHWEIHARIFGIIQLLNLVSRRPSTTRYCQFFCFSFFSIIHTSLSLIFGGVVMVCSSFLIWATLSNNGDNIVMIKGYAHLHAPAKIRSSRI